jgi:formiminotetrahydrofolate cyclodeaminase
VSGEEELVARARELREQVEPLAAEDAAAYAAFLRGEPGARERTIAVPVRLAALAGELIRLCEIAAERADGPHRGDAQTGALLSEAAARAAAALISINRGASGR